MHVGLHKGEYGSFAKWRPLPPGSYSIGEGFWRERQEANRKNGLQHGYEQLEKAGNFHDLKLAAGLAGGEFVGKVFMDSDVYKWLEAVAFELYRQPDRHLQEKADEAIGLIIAAQGEDGYINSYYQTAEPDKRWSDLARGHELYCAGHLMEAAIAFHRLLGDKRLLEVSCRFADYIDSVFGPGKRRGVPGHPEIELALVELYRETGQKRYLDLALFFLDNRGSGLIDPGKHGGHGGPAVYQDHVTVREASTLEGHAVRQLYLTAGVADAYLETGEKALFDAMEHQWHDFTCRKMFVTGGAGQIHSNEAFSEPYELPNSRAYSETCAAIASIMWNWRLLLATGEGRFADLIEHTLFNAFLSGVSLDSKLYFYVNPLLSRGTNPHISRKRIERLEWPWTPCCPPNVMRLFAMLEHYASTAGEGGIQIHQYLPGIIEAEIDSEKTATIEVTTDYPWKGEIIFKVKQSTSSNWALSLRIPKWAEEIGVMVNGKPIENTDKRDGYLILERSWKTGDTIELRLYIKPYLVEAHPRLDSAWSAVALKRGPLLYCLEQRDQAFENSILDVQINERTPLREVWEEDLLGGVMSIEADGYAMDRTSWENRLYRPFGYGGSASAPGRSVTLKAIPYYAWANRGANAMRVWIPFSRDR